jgi:two-component system phosphate regulon sensor histidine kinase PhoR
LFKKNYIVIITAFCGVALLGLIAIQFYWINAAIEQGENELENNIINSSYSIREEIDNYQALNAINCNDPNQILTQINGVITQMSNNSNISIQGYSQLPLMDQIMNQYLSGCADMPIEERLPQKSIDSIIELSLRKNGINTEYEFGIFENDEVAFANVSNVDNLLNSKYVMDVFPNDLFHTFQLALFIPNERQLVIGSMWMMLFVSALFILVIIFAFYYTISTIVRQKKVSMIKSDFINNMTHELKTPISTISLACEALSDADLAASVDARSRFVTMISDENKRLGVLVENVLQSAVLDRGELKLQLEEIDVHAVITKVVANINIQVQQRQGSIEIEFNANEPFIMADRVHFSNVISNLLDNAIKYSADAPKIKISTVPLVDAVIIKVEDNGIGMAKEHQTKVFDKLYRIPTGDRHDVKGFGLGLSYVQSIIQSHSGTISVQSTLGEGSTFSINLPTIKKQQYE